MEEGIQLTYRITRSDLRGEGAGGGGGDAVDRGEVCTGGGRGGDHNKDQG